MNPGNIEILAYEDTPLGLLCLRRRELLGDPGTFVTEITLNHEFLMSSLNTASERALASLAHEEWRAGRASAGGGDESAAARVLIGGLGLGYTAQAALALPKVGQVDVIELLPPVITWLEEGLVPLSDELNADARLRLIEGDAYEQLVSLAQPGGDPFADLGIAEWALRESGQSAAAPPEPVPLDAYDLILIDIDHSPDDRLGGLGSEVRASDRFYTEEGLQAVKGHLAPGGVLAVWSYEESSPFAEAMSASFDVTRFEPVTFENLLIEEEQTDWIFLGRDAEI